MTWFKVEYSKGGVLNHFTAFSCCCLVQRVVCCHASVYGYTTMLKRVCVYACIIAQISKTPFEIKLALLEIWD